MGGGGSTTCPPLALNRTPNNPKKRRNALEKLICDINRPYCTTGAGLTAFDAARAFLNATAASMKFDAASATAGS